MGHLSYRVATLRQSFRPSQHVLNLVAASINLDVMWDEGFAVPARCDAGFDASFLQSFAEPVGVITPICPHPIRSRQ